MNSTRTPVESETHHKNVSITNCRTENAFLPDSSNSKYLLEFKKFSRESTYLRLKSNNVC